MMDFLMLDNGAACAVNAIPCVEMAEFRAALIDGVTKQNCRVSAFCALDINSEKRLLAVLLDSALKKLKLLSSKVGTAYPALTCDAPAFHWFEREIWEEHKILPEGHRWLKPIRFSAPDAEIGVTDYFTLQGEAAHEVAVGPVHAGVIEPGHFRFQCMGEDVHFLEIELGYQCRGVEKLLSGGPDVKTLHLIETAAGDSSIAAALNYCAIAETMNHVEVPPRAVALRTLALELERIANHIGDLGALAGDVAFLPTSSFCGRIRGDFLNMTAKLCGNRFGRNFVIPGGVRFDLDDAGIAELQKKVLQGEKELFHALGLMFDAPSVLDRLENTGVVTAETAREIGMVGVAARASGVALDVRRDLNCDDFIPETVRGGDVLSRALVRKKELVHSLDVVKRLLAELPSGEVQTPCPATLTASTLGIHLVEAWRGELCHLVLTDENGKIRYVKIVDPSFHNWFGLAMALRGQQISDFPICNKSFNLSYCGHDL